MRFSLLVAALVGCLWISASQAATLQYTVTDLGTLGGSSSFAYRNSSSGQIVGYAFTAGNTGHAFLYSDGNTHAFLLTPVPEPGMFSQLAAAAMSTMLRRRCVG